MSDRLKGFLSKFTTSLLLCCLLLALPACNPPQRVSAEERLFRNFSLEFVDQYDIPKTTFKNTVVGGLSAIAYNRESDLCYVLSDDRGIRSPARFYTFKLGIEQTADVGLKIASFEPENITFLRDQAGKNYPQGAIDPEGLAISPRNTIFISSEGNPTKNIQPFIAEFELETGTELAQLRLPQRYLAGDESQPQGIQENLAFESLTINRTGLPEDPFRVFTATESALLQDESFEGEEQARVRLLHYIINPVGNPVLLAEHLYLLEPAPADVIANGLTELLALRTEGYFLSLERTFGFTGAGAKIFQVVIGNATDTTNIASLKGNIPQVQPLRKKLLFDLADLGIYLDNLEGMTIGPRLPDGSRSLLLISDDNFNEEQISQLLLFRLVEN
ncbi:MAG: esterase-like activity of phytase family protein [Cyanobacteria bacterium P01_A01_bin.40]